MTLSCQQIYNKVAKHLLTQNERSVDGDGCCMYRGNNGLKCAIGCLIKNDYYDCEKEGNTVDEIRVMLYNSDVIAENSSTKNYNKILLMGDLQDVHDNNEPEEWKEELKKVAKQHCLKPYKAPKRDKI